MPVAEAHRGRGRKPATSALAAARRQSIPIDEEEERPTKVQPMELEDDDNDREEPDADLDEGEEEEEHLDEAEEEEEEVEEVDEEQGSSNETSEPEEHVEPPAFSLATLGLQRVGSAPPPKPKGPKAPILTLNARGMPARIRKKNPLFYDENIINDDKPLRMSLAPKKPGRPPLSAGGGSAKKVPPTPSKVLQKRKGVVSRYMRSSDHGPSSTSASSQQQPQQQLGKHKKTPSKATPVGKVHMTGKLVKSGRGAHLIGKGSAAAAAAAAAAAEEATQAEASAAAHKRLGQSIGMRLRNLLKLPKAHKWAIAEWFYSYVDKPLFESRDEFMNHVTELAPKLGTRSLNRHEWVNIRRRMGRPRRCSANFFYEERKELDRKRQLIRTLQSRKPGEFKDSLLLADMPEKIPMPLPLGTKVTARLRSPQDGIFAGTVAAYDSLNAMYRVTFERPGLGTHAIPDYEIVSENFHEMLPLHSFTKDFRPNLMSVYQTNNLGFTTNLGFMAKLSSNYLQKNNEKGAGGAGAGAGAGGGAGTAASLVNQQKHLVSSNADARKALTMQLNKSDPLLGQDSVAESPIRQQLARHHRHNYSSTLLEHLLHLEKHIAVKADRIQRLRKMNGTAELALAEMISQDENGECHRRQIADNFQRQYAYNIVSIEKNNVDLMFELTKVQELSSSLSRNPNVQAMISPTYMREECRAKAAQTVDEMNKGMVKNPRMIRLLKNLTTLLILTQNLSGDLKVFEGCLEEVRTNLFCSDNSEVFKKSVQARLEYIAMDITKTIEEQKRLRSSSKGEETEEEHLDKEEDEEESGESAKTKTKENQPDERNKEQVAAAGKIANKLEELMDTEEDEEDEEDVEKLDSDESDNAEHPKQTQIPQLTQQQKEQLQKQQQQLHLQQKQLQEKQMELQQHQHQPPPPKEHEPEEEPEMEEHHLEPEPEEHSPNPAGTDDTQITIESLKESEEEFLSNAETEEEDDMGDDLEQLKMSSELSADEFVYVK